MTRLIILMASALTLLTACETGRTRHGVVVKTSVLQGIELETDTRTDIQTQLGSPPITGLYDDNLWVYVSEEKRHTPILAPQTIGRQIVVIRFDDKDTVSRVERYTLEQARSFAFETRTTLTQGQGQTWLEQVFGAIGLQLDVNSSGPAY